MKRNLLGIAATVCLACLLALSGGCSKIAIYIEDGSGGNGSQSGGNADQTLVTFHASVEGRNMTRALTPISKNVQVQLFAFSGTAGSAAGTPAATGEYESSMPGMLAGVAGYKMYLTDGVYNFYAFSENLSYRPIKFSGGQSEPLFNGIDYLWWRGLQQDVSSQQVSVPIVFLHSATQVAFEVEAGAGVTLNQLVFAHITAPASGARMDLSTGVIPPTTSYETGPADKMGINGFLAQYIMLPLKTTTPMQASFDVIVNGETSARTYSVAVPVPDGELIAGNSYRFKAVIQANGIELPSVSVTDWVDVDETGKPLYPKQ